MKMGNFIGYLFIALLVGIAIAGIVIAYMTKKGY